MSSEHPGIYISVDYSNSTVKDIRKLQNKLKIKSDHDLHTTIVHSTVPVAVIPTPRSKLKMERVRPLRFHIFDGKKGFKILVLIVDSRFLTSRFDDIHSKGAVTDFIPYIPHITLDYRWEGTLPSDDLLKGLELEFRSETIEAMSEGSWLSTEDSTYNPSITGNLWTHL